MDCLEQFPMDSVWGMHNWPGMDEGNVAVHKGSVMAAADRFEVTVKGNGGHAAMPQATNDPVLATTAIVQALQQIVSRKQNPLDAVVVSVTQINAGSGFNIIPQVTDFIGTIRTVNSATRINVHKQFKEICKRQHWLMVVQQMFQLSKVILLRLIILSVVKKQLKLLRVYLDLVL